MTSSFSADEQQRYQRHFKLTNFGPQAQQLLRQARVLCIGAGGLGSPLLLYLAAAGVGELGIVDGDHVDISNLQRQILYSSAQVQQKKVAAAKQRLLDLNSHIHINTYAHNINSDNAFDLIEPYDIVVDGSDNFTTRYLLNDVCYHLRKPLVFAAISKFSGQCSVFTFNESPCYRCLFPSPPPPGLINNCAEDGVLGVLPGVMGTIQATEVIKLLTGLGETLQSRLLTYDALTMSFQTYPIEQQKDCLLCAEKTAFADLPRYDEEYCTQDEIEEITAAEFHHWQTTGKPHFLLDVRQAYEYEQENIGGINIPLAELEAHVSSLPKDQPIVVTCQAGIRSRYAIKLLQAHGITNTWNLQGGIGFLKQTMPLLSQK